MNSTKHVVVAGGGAAGFFAAIICAEHNPEARITILEGTAHVLTKVKISGGGRCNVTHHCFEPKLLVENYPRGHRELIGPFNRWQASDTVAWFEEHGVRLKTEKDGRMFPITDSSQTVIDCLLEQAKKHGISIRTNCELHSVTRKADSGFHLELSNQETLDCDCLLLATGGIRAPRGGEVAISLGHTLNSGVPSLFTFQVEDARLKDLSGVSVSDAVVSFDGSKTKVAGPVLITHWGLSGPAVLKLSAWAARELHDLNYKFSVKIHWIGGLKPNEIERRLQQHRIRQGGRAVGLGAAFQIPQRLWARLATHSGIPEDRKWSELKREELQMLIRVLSGSEFQVLGKSLNKEEFVTCGGISLKEMDFKTMQSRICPGLYFAGEILDIDGITGGFNFQNAWTTGYLAGCAMAHGEPVE